jgi:predicted component of type VI protein secretion system
MFICRLFHHDRPFEQIEARLIVEGQTTVGRDPAADWSLIDPQGVLSRIHCTLSVEDGRLFLTDGSTNGTFLEGGIRAPAHEPVELRPRQSIRLGDLSILVDQPQGAAADATTLHGGLDLAPTPVPRDWSDPQPAVRPHRDGSLIEAFCEGAGLDASALSGQEPHELMTRIGAIYQQTVLGLATLMADRARVKSEAQLDRTTLGAQANNPFKWTPTRRLAQDLLCGAPAGFLADSEAVRASFEDLGRHMAAMAQGANAAANLAVQTLAPEVIDAEARRQGSLLKSQQALRWEIHNHRHAALTAAEDPTGGPLRHAFVEAYRQAASKSDA